jgi:hypothetical protein
MGFIRCQVHQKQQLFCFCRWWWCSSCCYHTLSVAQGALGPISSRVIVTRINIWRLQFPTPTLPPPPKKERQSERKDNILHIAYIPQFSRLCREKYLKKSAVEYKVGDSVLACFLVGLGVNLELDYRLPQCILNLAFWDITVVHVECHNGLEFFIDKMARVHNAIYVTE